MPFTSCGGCLKDIFITEAEIIDRYVGNQLWLWGVASSGKLGNNLPLVNRSSPIQTVSGGTNWRSVSSGPDFSAAIKTDGTLWLWGNQANDGKLGTNSLPSRSSPVQTVSGGTNWKQVSAGRTMTGAIKTDGTLWLWGLGLGGQLGNNSTVARSSPIQTVSGGTNWKQVSAGINMSGAIKTDGTLWLWGCNRGGSLGTNDGVSRSSPVQTVSGGTNWKQVSISVLDTDVHTAAIKTDGTLWLWGHNLDGRLGDNSIISRSSPVQTISGGTNWKQVSAGGDEAGAGFTAAIKTDGTLWLWGINGRGRLGDNTIIDKSSPVQTVSGGTNWKQVSIHTESAAAIKTDGTLWLWGRGEEGQLGDNTRINRSSPVQTVSGGTNWKQVSAGGDFAAAVTHTEL